MVFVVVLGLAAHRLLPGNAEPREVLIDRRLVFRPAARLVDILDAQQQPSVRGLRHAGVDERRQRMAEMQIAVGRRREAENGWHANSTRHTPRKRGIQPFSSMRTGAGSSASADE